MVLEYPDGETLVAQRGSLMGLPHTWSFLNIIHLAAWNDAVLSQWRDDTLEDKAELYRLLDNVQICGDDLIGCAPLHIIERYNENLLGFGLEFSKTKHFVS